jgi:2-keto-4-pentenoate hydratase/2-oxohepta-3-ene-1,7-dioic acid hydratase in catechol pathway
MTSERILRFSTADGPRWGIAGASSVEELSHAPWDAAATRTGRTHALAGLRLLAPATPSKVLALGYNFKDLFADPAARTSAREPHYTDHGFEPIVFLKGPNTIADPDGDVVIPSDCSEVWVEVEVCAVIGRRARNLRDASAARDAVLGLTIGNDITALNVLGRDWHLARSKSLDGFCPIGPAIIRGFDDTDVAMRTTINGRQTQSSTSANRVLDTYAAVAFASRLMTLEPGDIVMTGTPAGARQSLVRPGDRVEVSIEGLGTLATHFIAERTAS